MGGVGSEGGAVPLSSMLTSISKTAFRLAAAEDFMTARFPS